MSVRRIIVAVGCITAAWCAIGIPARATYGARTAADEPQYLLTALSLWEDQNLDIADELTEKRWRDFHEAQLPEQTAPLTDGQRLSPHDPLLPVVLAVPMGLGGWAAAKATLAMVAGVLAGLLVWVAVRRFAVPVTTAAVVVLSCSLAAPLSAYGVQVYPELPAALVVTVAVAAVTGPLDGRGRWVLGIAVVALPWLSVKYAPVAATIAAVGLLRLWRGDRQEAGTLGAMLAVAGGLFLVFHRAVYGGWTVYAAGDHFVDGELIVVGSSPDYAGRSARLVGLLVDRSFGLVAWAPVFLVGVVAMAALVRRRPAGWSAIAAPMATGWLVATFVALTMHGWWWPGRQTVVVLPCVVLALAWWSAGSVRRTTLVAGLGAVGALSWLWVVAEALLGHLRLIIDFDTTANPLYRAGRLMLPDYRSLGWPHHVVWVAAIAVLAVIGWRSASPQRRHTNVELDSPGPGGPVARPVDGGHRVR